MTAGWIYRNVMAAVCIAPMLVVGTVHLGAQETDAENWRASIGGVARRIDDIRFRRSVLRHPNIQESPYVNFGMSGSAWQMLDPAVQAPGGYVPGGALSTAFVHADRATWRGDDEGSDALGGELELSRIFYRRESISCALLIRLTALDLDADTGARAAPGTTRGFDTAHSLFEIKAPNPPVDPALTPVTASGDWGAVGGSLLGPTSSAPGLYAAEAAVRSGMDAALYELGLGCRLSVDLGRLRLSASTGPTLALVDLESRLRQTVRTGGATARWGESDSESDWQLGWSARCGFDVIVSSQVSVGIGLRYDYVSGTVSTRHVELDPSGFGADARVTVSF